MEWVDRVKDTFSDLVNTVIDVLPKSPITYLASTPEVEKVMGYVNFFIPIYTMIGILEAWLTAIVIYYVVSVALRWLKVVE